MGPLLYKVSAEYGEWFSNIFVCVGAGQKSSIIDTRTVDR